MQGVLLKEILHSISFILGPDTLTYKEDQGVLIVLKAVFLQQNFVSTQCRAAAVGERMVQE